MGADRHEHLAGRPEASKRYGTTVMSAPTPAPGDESPREGYYPDPSTPRIRPVLERRVLGPRHEPARTATGRGVPRA
ncbi:hypothetical protein GA0115239_11781, partial [Streptomyces sp. BpilaLS-43]